MSSNFILMRHGLSEHNVLKQKMKQQHRGKRVKDVQSYKDFKLSETLMDSQLNQEGIKQSKQITKIINLSEIDIVYTSPLLRCLQTCYYIFQNSTVQKKPEVIVHPLLSDRLQNSWSLCYDFHKRKHQFPEFNFDECQDFQSHNLIRFGSIKNKNQEGALSTLNFLKEGWKQDYWLFLQRLNNFKDYVQKQSYDTNKRILIISHSSVLKTLIGKKFEQNGKIVSEIKFKNCEPILVSKQLLLHKVYPKRALNNSKL